MNRPRKLNPNLTPGWIDPIDVDRYKHPVGELRYLLFPAPLICVRLEPDHGIEAAINRVPAGYVARVVMHKTVINFGATRLTRVLKLTDAFIAAYIEHQRKNLMNIRLENINKYRPFLPERM